MAMSYYDEQNAKVAIMGELVRRGWTVYGYKPDQSDHMADYFSPASWTGVAEKDGAVICVGVIPYDVQAYSGGRDRYEYLPNPDDTCPACNGSGNEPGALSYREQVASSTWAVSPFQYHDNGVKKCLHCGGRGHMLQRVVSREDWPAFQANPKGSKWHVEKGGEIVAKGVGLSGCVFGKPEEVRANITRLVDKLEAAAFGKSTKRDKPKTAAKPAVKPVATFNRTGIVSWLTFATNPAQDVANLLTANGWRYAKKRSEKVSGSAWYNENRQAPPAGIAYAEQSA